jgi:hypothetical protein
MWAMYCLVLFFYATREELEPWRPVGKFVCVKSVVFFTWWQVSALASDSLAGACHSEQGHLCFPGTYAQNAHKMTQCCVQAAHNGGGDGPSGGGRPEYTALGNGQLVTQEPGGLGHPHTPTPPPVVMPADTSADGGGGLGALMK